MDKTGPRNLSLLLCLPCTIAISLLGCGGGGSSRPGGSTTVASIVSLGVDSNGLFLEPLALNNKGGIALLDTTSGEGVLRSTAGIQTDMTSAGSADFVIADSVNDNSLAAGVENSPFQAAVWDAGVITNLVPPSGISASTTNASAVNNLNQLIGTSSSSSTTTGLYWTNPSTPAVVLSPSQLTPLALNNAGKMVGVVINGGRYEWFTLDLSTGTTATDLSLGWSDPKGLGVVGSRPAGIAINDTGTIACSTGADSTVILISPSGVRKTILTNAVVYSINTQGDIVGNTVATKSVPFVYNSAKGLVDLNTLLPKNSGWSLGTAREINNLGQVVGVGLLKGALLGYRLQLPKGSF